METNNKCKHLRTDENILWCELGYMLQCDRCRERKDNNDEEYGDDIYIAIEAAFEAGAKWWRENNK